MEQVRSGQSAAVEPTEIPQAWINAVEALTQHEAFKPPKRSTSVGDGLRSYLLTGESLSVLGDTATLAAVKEALALTEFVGHDTGHRMTMLLSTIPLPAALRWVHLLEAVAQAQANGLHHYLALPRLHGKSWPEMLLTMGAGTSLSTYNPEQVAGVPVALMERLLVAEGLPASALLAAAFSVPPGALMADYRIRLVAGMPGHAEALDRHLEDLRSRLRVPTVPQQLWILQLLMPAQPATLARIATELAQQATCGSRVIRQAVDPLVTQIPEAIYAPLQGIATSGVPDQRQHALRLVYRLGLQAQRQDWLDWARSTALADKASSVQSLARDWEDAAISLDAVRDVGEKNAYQLPVIDWTPDHTPDDAALRRLWDGLIRATEEDNLASVGRHAQNVANGHNWPLHQHALPDAADRDALLAYMRQANPKPDQRTSSQRRVNWRFVPDLLEKLVEEDQLSPVSTMKLLVFFNLAFDHAGLMHPANRLIEQLHAKTGRPTLLELACIVEGFGESGASVLASHCSTWGGLGEQWPEADVWPYLAHYSDVLTQRLLNPVAGDYRFDRDKLFKALAKLPSPPASIVNTLFDLALGSGKQDRPRAQQALARWPDKEARILAALGDGKGDARSAAATWLAALRHAPAVPALEQAIKKEKQDLVKGAMLDALQALGQPIEKYLDRAQLEVEATKGLAKGVPKELDWFPWDALPVVHWQDSGAPVPTNSLRWLLVQAVKQKSPEPNVLLRKYLGMLTDTDRETLGQWVLEAWLREDVRPVTQEEGLANARKAAQERFNSIASYPQYSQGDPYLGKSVEEITAAMLPGCLNEPAGSAIGSKGLLAVTAATARERAAAPVQRYIKAWYGQRAAQGKALIAMLAWIEHPSATQLMLAVGTRFRTKSFQEEASKQAAALAERKGWTVAELADRTVPTAGFDESGVLTLSFGPRSFSARLLPDFKIDLFNEDGKKITALPEPRQDDDASAAQDAKKALSAAKKELKTIVSLQTERLYEALCTERGWPMADWRRYLFEHPILRHLVQRLVWVWLVDGEVAGSFRPLEDGTLTDVEDNEVGVPDDAQIRLAHDSLLDEAQVKAWLAHLADYEIAPLFQQLGKGVVTWTDEQLKGNAVKRFEGHLLEAFALRGRATKLGYVRGATGDGGWFTSYEKRFPTLGLQAEIEFTGNPLPEENRTVALLALTFTRTGQEGGYAGQNQLPLAEVPRILLGECFNDLRLIAAEGTGFDPEWRKKSEY